MSLVKNYEELNKFAEDIVKVVSEINEEYLKEDIEYPYGKVANLVNKYDLMLGKVLKKRYSLFNDFLNKVNSKREEQLRKLDAPNKYEVLNIASEKAVPLMLDVFKNNEVIDEGNKELIDKKIFPIVKNMDLKTIVSLYRKSKEIVSQTNDYGSLVNLQALFVGYIISNIMHDPSRGRFRTNVRWTYEEICTNILNEEVLEEINKENRKSM